METFQNIFEEFFGLFLYKAYYSLLLLSIKPANHFLIQETAIATDINIVIVIFLLITSVR